MIELIGSLFILAGAVFLFSAGLGLLRMPDAYTRIQAGTKATTLGNMLVLTGLAFYHPGWIFKLILVIYFVVMTNPVSSHALSRAAHRIRTPMTSSTIADALAEDEILGDGAPTGGADRGRKAGRRKRS
jgi:multicomponent Na+:H+ antiporter subunit G